MFWSLTLFFFFLLLQSKIINAGALISQLNKIENFLRKNRILSYETVYKIMQKSFLFRHHMHFVYNLNQEFSRFLRTCFSTHSDGFFQICIKKRELWTSKVTGTYYTQISWQLLKQTSKFTYAKQKI